MTDNVEVFACVACEMGGCEMRAREITCYMYNMFMMVDGCYTSTS